jgi:hypothetical protein
VTRAGRNLPVRRMDAAEVEVELKTGREYTVEFA